MIHYEQLILKIYVKYDNPILSLCLKFLDNLNAHHEYVDLEFPLQANHGYYIILLQFHLAFILSLLLVHVYHD